MDDRAARKARIFAWAHGASARLAFDRPGYQWCRTCGLPWAFAGTCDRCHEESPWMKDLREHER